MGVELARDTQGIETEGFQDTSLGQIGRAKQATLDTHGMNSLGDGTRRGARSLRNSRELDGRLGDACDDSQRVYGRGDQRDWSAS